MAVLRSSFCCPLNGNKKLRTDFLSHFGFGSLEITLREFWCDCVGREFGGDSAGYSGSSAGKSGDSVGDDMREATGEIGGESSYTISLSSSPAPDIRNTRANSHCNSINSSL